MAAKLIVSVISLYRKYISGIRPGKCRFYPTCSLYAVQAVEKYGALKAPGLP